VTLGQLAAFLAVAAVVICTPGQDTLLTVRHALAGGRRAGVQTAAGVATGQAAWTLAASLGLTAVLVASETAFHALRLAGAAYLVLLGALTVRHAMRNRSAAAESRAQRGAAAFRQGFLSNLANPKMAVFFTGLLPQFGSSLPALLALGLAFCTLTFLWLAAYAAVVARAGDAFRRSRLRRTLEAAMGALLVALGVRAAAARG
jgi:threonine/homoserine/homoserine lactone efflux protein